MIYGYCRISTPQQSMARQVRNIKNEYPTATIVKEIFTGRNVDNRKELGKIIKTAKAGDTLVFDSVSRLSRDSEAGFKLYEELFNKDIDLVFLKEPHINTETYKKAFNNKIEMTGTDIDYVLEGINKYLLALAKEQIRIAFEQSEKEVQDLRQRTKEGIESARLEGKQIGQPKGAKLVTKKSIAAKEIILKHNQDFKGTLNNNDTMKLADISRNTFYKYKRELKQEHQEKPIKE